MTRYLYNEMGANIHKADSNDGKSPFHIACMYGHEKVVRYLIGLKVPVNDLDFNGRSPFWVACSVNRLRIVEILMEAGAERNRADNFGQSPFLITCSRIEFNSNVAELLARDSAVAINLPDDQGVTPMHVLCEAGNHYIVAILLERGVDIDAVSSDGKTPLHAAVEGRQKGMVDVLLNQGARIDIPDLQCRTPYYMAHDDVDMCFHLLRQHDMLHVLRRA